MVLDDDDPRLNASANALQARLQPFVGLNFDASRLEQICEIVREHRIAFKREHGAEFPPLVPFVLPSVRFIHFVRADLEDQIIRNQLRNLIVQLSRRQVLPSAIELAAAVRQCWPRYRPPIEEFRADPLLKQRLQ
jgi:hypothetical protein